MNVDTVDTGETQALGNTRSRAWCFTWNNYTSEDLVWLLAYCVDHKYVIGKEVGTENTPHLQGYIYFANARSFNSMRELLKNNHVEMARDKTAAMKYCTKEGDFFTNIKKLQDANYFKCLHLRKYDGVVWRPWQQQIIDIMETEPNSRTINWFWESNGNTGKSFLAKYLYLKYGAIIADGKKDNVFNQVKIYLEGHPRMDIKLVILDIPRYNLGYENYGVLEKLKDGLIYSGKYEGGVCVFNAPHVVVFANQPPDETRFSEDRWNIVCIDQDS